MKKAKLIKPLKNKLDKAFSEYIRRKYADKKGIVACVTCGAKKPWKQMQAGHYIKRSHMATRWYELNVYPQCCGCNMFLHGNYPKFTEWIIKNKGLFTLEYLLDRQKEIVKISQADMQVMLEDYRQKLLEMED